MNDDIGGNGGLESPLKKFDMMYKRPNIFLDQIHIWSKYVYNTYVSISKYVSRPNVYLDQIFKDQRKRTLVVKGHPYHMPGRNYIY